MRKFILTSVASLFTLGIMTGFNAARADDIWELQRKILRKEQEKQKLQMKLIQKTGGLYPQVPFVPTAIPQVPAVVPPAQPVAPPPPAPAAPAPAAAPTLVSYPPTPPSSPVIAMPPVVPAYSSYPVTPPRQVYVPDSLEIMPVYYPTSSFYYYYSSSRIYSMPQAYGYSIGIRQW